MSEYFKAYADGQLFVSSINNSGVLDFTIDKEINKSGSASFTILPTHPMWNSFKRMVTVVDVYIRDKNVFHGRVTEIETDFYKQRSVKCEGALGWLVDNYKYVIYGDDQDILLNPYPDIPSITDELAYGFNANNVVEQYKHFSVGHVEYVPPLEELIPDNTKVGENKISTSDGTTILDDFEWTYSTKYVDIYDGDKDSFISYIGYVEQSESDWTDRGQAVYYFYDINKAYLGYLNVSNNHTVVNAPLIPQGSRYFRISAKCSINDIFSVAPEKHTDPDESFSGGTYAEYFTKWIVEYCHMMIRSRYDQTRGNLLDVLNPERNEDLTPTATIEFSRNMVGISSESVDVDPYSVILPLFGGKAEVGDPDFYYVDIPSAISQYGRIVKGIDFGDKPDQTNYQEMYLYSIKIQRFINSYSTAIPDKFTVDALDDGIIFDNDQLSIIDVGDVVKIVSRPHDISKTLLCLSMKLDLFNPGNNSYVIGKYASDDEDWRVKTLTESFAKTKKNQDKSSST